MVFFKAILFGILVVNGLLPVTAKNELPRPRFSSKNSRPIKNLNDALKPKTEPRILELEDDYEDYPYRRDKQYRIKVDLNSSLLKKLQELVIQNGDDSYESELPVQKIIIVNYDDLIDNDSDNRLKFKNSESKLFDKYGMFFNKLKAAKRVSNSDERAPEDMNLLRNRKEKPDKDHVYQFSDLVL